MNLEGIRGKEARARSSGNLSLGVGKCSSSLSEQARAVQNDKNPLESWVPQLRGADVTRIPKAGS